MRTRLTGIAVAVAIALLLPAAALAADPPVAVYHGTWTSAGWTYDEASCPFPPDVPASGNWNVTILPGGRLAAVHLNAFALGMHIDAWGGSALGDFWAVDSVTPNGFALHLDLRATPLGSWNTFVLSGDRLTFTIAPWVAGPFSCSAAMSYGQLR